VNQRVEYPFDNRRLQKNLKNGYNSQVEVRVPIYNKHETQKKGRKRKRVGVGEN